LDTTTLTQTRDLTQRSFNAGVWLLAANVAQRVLRLSIGVLLARMLLPADFGVVGMIAFFWVLSGLLMRAGFGAGVIQRKDADEVLLSSFFYYNFAVGIVLCIVLALAAPAIATFFGQPVLARIVPIAALSLPIGALATVPGVILVKEIRHGARAVAQFTSALVSGGLALWLASRGHGVWALVWQQLAGVALSTVLICAIVRWRPRCVFSLAALRSIAGFSVRMLGSDVLDVVSNYSYNVVIGKWFAAADLGYFLRGRAYGEIWPATVARTAGAITFPALSLLQHDVPRAVGAFRRSLLLVMSVSVMPTVLIVLLAKPIVVLLLTERWLPAVPILQVMAASYVFYPWTGQNWQILAALGHAGKALRMEFAKKTLMILSVIVTAPFGVMAMVYGYLAVSLASVFLGSWYAKELFDYSVADQFRDLLPSLALVVPAGAVAWACQALLPADALFLRVFVPGALGLGVYAAMHLALRTEASSLARKLVSGWFKR